MAVIGAGWYGCHIALSLMALGMEIDVFEKAHRPLHSASGNNQFRLHLGFHYARHYMTRLQSRDGFVRFMERYPSLSAAVPENIYAVPRGSSLIDFATYKLIMVSSGIHFTESEVRQDLLTDVEGMMLTSERVLLIDRARRYFTDRLANVLHLDTPADGIEERNDSILLNGKAYDYVIDATWGHRGDVPIPVYYEPTLLLYYETNGRFPAITFVDGPLCSVYPTEDPTIYTLSSVPHTPLGHFNNAAAAEACRDSVDATKVAAKRKAMEVQILRNVPGFHDNFRFVGIQTAVKTKPVGLSDDRSCHVFKNGRKFTVLSGKIDTIFFATERILSMIEASHSGPVDIEVGGIKQDIIYPSA